MPIMPSVNYQKSAVQAKKFHPVGLVLHRTAVMGYQRLVSSFKAGPKSPHFMIGKRDGEVVQLIDTDYRGAHAGPGANALYLGIEFESITSNPKIKGLDPAINADELTPAQICSGRDVIDWICRTHNIPKLGPPSAAQMRQGKGRWHGILSHADVANSGYFHTTHGDTILFIDYIALGIWPK
jgi:N-acetyl-anhydromuramyl-L-alanine amidase AmpD